MAFNHSIKTGFSFGLTSGIITTLGLIVGLHSGTHSSKVVIGGILTIAIADSFSDALGIHISEESKNKHTNREIWAATISTLVFKFLFAITFLAPILLFPLSQAIILCLVWGLGLLCAFSFFIAKEQHVTAWKVILEHLVIAVAVIILTHYVGVWIGSSFG
ncbi:MAG: hypothetical protein U9R02_15650 [Thermodesulfobacteriota bacterium]|nr:hypothetical protein [Thermodesulfobacteriota bacterium]